MNVPENARELVGTGTPEDSEEGEAQQERLAAWVRLLEDERVMENVIASYQVVPLLSEYAPRINPQQLKNALIDRTECGPGGADDSGARQALAQQLVCGGSEGGELPRSGASQSGGAVAWEIFFTIIAICGGWKF